MRRLICKVRGHRWADRPFRFCWRCRARRPLMFNDIPDLLERDFPQC